jgi:hypothetical protein
VVAAVAFVRSSVPCSWSLPPSVPGRCTELTGTSVPTLAVGLVVTDVATDATVAAGVAGGGGCFKFALDGSVCLEADEDADDTDVRAVLAAAIFLLAAADRLLPARSRAMVLSEMSVGITGKSYFCEVLGNYGGMDGWE